MKGKDGSAAGQNGVSVPCSTSRRMKRKLVRIERRKITVRKEQDPFGKGDIVDGPSNGRGGPGQNCLDSSCPENYPTETADRFNECVTCRMPQRWSSTSSSECLGNVKFEGRPTSCHHGPISTRDACSTVRIHRWIRGWAKGSPPHIIHSALLLESAGDDRTSWTSTTHMHNCRDNMR